MLALIALIFSAQVWAQSAIFSADAPKPVGAEQKMPHEEVRTLDWGGAAEYVVRTNYADRASPRLYLHQLNLNYGFQHLKSGISVYGGAGLSSSVLGDQHSEVVSNEYGWDDHIENLSVGLQRGFRVWNDKSLTLTLENEFPTSPEARREQYNSVSSLRAELGIPLFEKRVQLSAMSELIYIWNSYSYSPATLRMHKKAGWTGMLSGRVRLIGGLWASASVGSQTSLFYDGTTDQIYRNSVSLLYTFSRYLLVASYSNGTYADRQEASLWFVDEYRRVASLRASVSF